MTSMFKLVNDWLDKWFSQRFNPSLLMKEASILSQQRSSFLRLFGPEALRTLEGANLLAAMACGPGHKDSVFYWLFFRDDEMFSQNKFSSSHDDVPRDLWLWWNEEEQTWVGSHPGATTLLMLTQEQALDEAEHRATELLRATQIIEQYRTTGLRGLSPAQLQHDMEAAAPRWGKNSWLHKYLHLVFPDRVTWHHKLSFSSGTLLRLAHPLGGDGLYSLDQCHFEFWKRFPSCKSLPPQLRYRIAPALSPRTYACLHVSGDLRKWRWFRDNHCLATGPKTSTSLSSYAEMNARDREQAYSSLYGEHSAEYVKQQDFLLPLLALQPGCLLLVMLDSQTAAGLGEVVGGYQFQSDSKLPHQVPIRWFTTEGFDIQHGQGQREGLHPVQPKEQLAAEMEAAWLVLTQPKSFEEFQVGTALSAQKIQRKKKGLCRSVQSLLSPPQPPQVSEDSKSGGWQSRWILEAADDGGLAVEFDVLEGLLPFIKILELNAKGQSIRMLASNLKAGVWRQSVLPSSSSFHVVALGFEDDEDVQVMLQPLSLVGLSNSAVSVFVVDRFGTGRYCNTTELFGGQTYRLLFPPALHDSILPAWNAKGHPNARLWNIVEWELPLEEDKLWTDWLQHLGFSLRPPRYSVQFPLSARQYKESPKGIRYPSYDSEDTLAITIHPLPNDWEGKLRIFLADGDTTQEYSANLKAPEWFQFPRIESGLYGLSVYVENEEQFTETQYLEITDASKHLLPSAQCKVLIDTEHLYIDEDIDQETSIALDFEELLLPEAGWRIHGPPCWKSFVHWSGYELHRWGNFTANKQGEWDTSLLKDYITPRVSNTPFAQLTLNFGELGQLTLQHQRDWTEATLQNYQEHLRTLWLQVKADFYDDDLARHMWFTSLTEILGYKPTQLHGSHSELVLYSAGLSRLQVSQHGQVWSPYAALFCVPQGTELLRRKPGSNLYELESMLGPSYQQMFVTDGKLFTVHRLGSKLRRRPFDMERVLSPTHLLEWEEFLDTLLARPNL